MLEVITNKTRIVLFISGMVLIASLIALMYVLEVKEHKQRANRGSIALIHQVENVLRERNREVEVLKGILEEYDHEKAGKGKKELKRLKEELATNNIAKIMKHMLVYDGTTILVADAETGTIEGTTSTEYLDGKLFDLIPKTTDMDFDKIWLADQKVNGQLAYIAIHQYNNYVIAVLQDSAVVNGNIGETLKIVFIYLSMAAMIITLLAHYMTENVRKEKKKAATDAMTGFFNRRGYVKLVKEQEEKKLQENFAYISIDINGLKQVNDSRGHIAGDELINGAAQCIRDTFEDYGTIFRMGGDEFVVIAAVEENQLHHLIRIFKQSVKKWHGEKAEFLSVSCGIARCQDYPGKSIKELVAIADAKMYREKEQYYKDQGTVRNYLNYIG